MVTKKETNDLKCHFHRVLVDCVGMHTLLRLYWYRNLLT